MFCQSLEVIPTLNNLTSLETIDMVGCSRLRSFPDIPSTIIELEVAHTVVEEWPASLRYCSRLDFVDLSNNRNLKTFLTHLPTSVTFINLSKSSIERICINGLHNLTHLILSSCKRLASLPELPGSLKMLEAANCISLESVSDPLNTPNAVLRFNNCIKLSRQARGAIIQGSFGRGCALLPGRKVPKEFDYRTRGNSLTISHSTFKRIKVCVVTSPDEQVYCDSVAVLCRWKVVGNSVKSDEITFCIDYSFDVSDLSTEHLFIFHISLPFSDPSEVSRMIVLEFTSIDPFDIIECGVQILRDKTDGSNNGDEDDVWDIDESNEASDNEEDDDDSIFNRTFESESDEASDKEDDEDEYKSESGEASNKENGEDGFKSESGEASEEKYKGMGDEGVYESVSRKRLRKTSVLTATAFSSQAMAQFTFPDSSAALGAPPPPTYGFHMLEQCTIPLTDGSVHSNLALSPNYQDSPPPFHPEEFRDHAERPLKRKYPDEDEIERAEMLRQSQQFMNYANPNDQSVAGTSSSPFLMDVGEDDRAAKHMRIGPC